jgi:peptidoglycan/xylan/chitin deacetylase (PgdA/CDA1 family)
MMTEGFPSKRARFKARVRSFFALAASLSGIAFVWNHLVARHGARILAYHGVEREPTSPFSVSLKNFEDQLSYLAENFEVVDLKTILKWQKGEYRATKPLVALTFDDGFVNNLELAAPVLKRHLLPATFFVIASKCDGSDARFMDAEGLRAMQGAGAFEIGSHTLNHRSVAQIDEAEKQVELGRSRTLLQETLSREITCFCYPYGTFNDFDLASVNALKANGYTLGLTSINGINLRGTDPYRLRRTKVEWSDDPSTFRRLMAGALDGWYLVDYFLRFLQKPRAVAFGQQEREAIGTR